jgi:hypothetical protein
MNIYSRSRMVVLRSCQPSRGAVPLHTEAAGTAPPDAFGPFRVLHQVGAGTLGPVFRAYDSDGNRLVAVKLFRLDVPPERMHRLVAEFEALVAAELAHPAIAAPLATGTDGIAVYLVLEYVPADSLDVVIRDHGLALPGHALRVAVELAGALDFAAVVDVHHGVLHPRDVLMSPDEPRLTGLGVTGALERAGATAPLRRPYTAPERVAGGAWDRRADVFGLAALIHEMLWGRRLTAIGAEAALALTELPGGDLAALQAAFARALAFDPADRFGTALEFAAALQEAFPGVSLMSDQSRVVGRQSTAEPRLPLGDPPVEEGLEGDSLPQIAVSTTPEAASDMIGELELHASGTVRHEGVDAAAAMATTDLDVTPGPERVAAPTASEPARPQGLPPSEPARSSLWPVAAALAVGVAVGFGGGYSVAGRRARPAGLARGAPAQPGAAQIALAPPGREWTESAVNEPPRDASNRGRLRPDTASRGLRSTRDGADKPVYLGRLLVRSTPDGATVFVDGREQGRTPATVRDLARGAHRLRVARAGYVSEDRSIVVTAARPAQSVTVELKRPLDTAGTAARTPVPATPGSLGTFAGAALSVDSRPGGASVFIDGKLVGATPMVMPRVGAGEHAIRLERDGYQRWLSSIRIVAGEPGRVTASLEK